MRSGFTEPASIRSSRVNSSSTVEGATTVGATLRPQLKAAPGQRANANREPDHKESALLMADENPTGRASLDPSSPAGADKRTERAVLVLLLDEHPTRLTMDELILVLHADPEGGDPEDAAGRAVRELVGAGLMHREGRFLSPSRAALYFERLEMSR
jgi:hypothetical protein